MHSSIIDIDEAPMAIKPVYEVMLLSFQDSMIINKPLKYSQIPW